MNERTQDHGRGRGPRQPSYTPGPLDQGIVPQFPENVLAEAETAAGTAREAVKSRPDLSGLFSLAIDDPSTVEVDDALAVEQDASGFVVHVFISDVAAAVRRGTALDAEAAERAVTIYHPVVRVPMLPPVLSSDALSLLESGPRPVLDHRLYFDVRLSHYDSKVVPACARVDRRLSYEEADELLLQSDPEADASCLAASAEAASRAAAGADVAGGSGQNSAVAAERLLGVLKRLADALFEQRLERGALSFFPPEIRATVKDGVPYLRRIDTASSSRRLVAEFMIAAGAGAGAYLQQLKAPAIYRNQAPPDEPVRWSMEKARDPAFIGAVLRRLKRAEVTLNPGSHAGLGVSGYCQVTSPLRRYSDLLIQRQLHSVLTVGVPAYGEGELLSAMAQADQTAVDAHQVERRADDYWRRVALAGRKGQKVAATIVYTDRKQYQVTLPEFGLSARYFPRRERKPGDMIDLVLVAADPAAETLVLRED